VIKLINSNTSNGASADTHSDIVPNKSIGDTTGIATSIFIEVH